MRVIILLIIFMTSAVLVSFLCHEPNAVGFSDPDRNQLKKEHLKIKYTEDRKRDTPSTPTDFIHNNLTEGEQNNLLSNLKDRPQISSLPICQNVRHNCQGAKYFPNGEKYIGEFQNNQFNGFGIYVFSYGETYIGEWKDGQIHGQGSAIHENGAKYIGQSFQGRMHGYGTLTFADGSEYVGQFEKGKFHGYGKFTQVNGFEYQGQWNEGKYQDADTITKYFSALYDTFKDAGYKIIDRIDIDHRPTILKVKSRETIINVLVENDYILQLRKYFSKPKDFNESTANKWNERFRWAKAYIDKDKDLVLELDIIINLSEIDQQTTQKLLSRFFTASDIFSVWIRSELEREPIDNNSNNKSKPEDLNV